LKGYSCLKFIQGENSMAEPARCKARCPEIRDSGKTLAETGSDSFSRCRPPQQLGFVEGRYQKSSHTANGLRLQSLLAGLG
jgi:hypothetical protein